MAPPFCFVERLLLRSGWWCWRSSRCRRWRGRRRRGRRWCGAGGRSRRRRGCARLGPRWCWRPGRCGWLVRDGQQFHVEDQVSLGRDTVFTAGARMAVLAIGKLPGNEQPPFAANVHASEAGVPAWDDAVCADGKRRRSAMIRGGVELLAIRREPAGVVDGIKLRNSSQFAGANFSIDVFQRVRSMHDAMRRRNILGKRGAAGSDSRMVRVHRRSRRSGLGDGRGSRGEGKKGERCAKFHVLILRESDALTKLGSQHLQTTRGVSSASHVRANKRRKTRGLERWTNCRKIR